MPNEKTRTIEKLVTLRMQGVPDNQICDLYSLTAPEYEKIQKDEEYIDLLCEKTTEGLVNQHERNAGWDDVEDQALVNVLGHLEKDIDPDFALRAAAVANKAVRRRANNTPVTGAAGVRAVISLSTQFIDKVDGNMVIQHRQVALEQSAERIVDMPDMQQAMEILRPKTEAQLADQKDMQELMGKLQGG